MTRGRLIDADTLDLPDHGPVRLAGADAPENGQPARDADGREFDAGQAATDPLAEHLRVRQRDGWQVCIEEAGKGRDRYGRILGRVILKHGREREDACAWLVRAGWAVAEYGPPDYGREERLARREGAGLWTCEWQRPRDWRAARRGARGRPRRAARRRSGPGLLAVLKALAKVLRAFR